jgi:hypothetical protein
MSRITKLRIHLVGSNNKVKQKLALALRKELNRKVGRTTIVPDLQAAAEKRIEQIDRNHIFWLALENDYLRYQTDIATKTHHLIFLDSLVDRYCRSVNSKFNMDLYFVPQFSAARSGHIFLYGPAFDKQRSAVLSRYDLPSQLWADDDEVQTLMEAVKMRLGVGSGKR